MQTSQAYYVTKIKENLSLRQRQNPHYSLRAFARDLDMHPSTLSQVMKGKRGLPLKHASDIAGRLSLGPKEKTLFMESFFRTKTSIDDIKIGELDERFMLDESYYKVIAEWEHYAVLELFELKDFKLTIESVVQYFGITENRTDVVINNLLTCGLLIHNEQGELVKAHPDIRTTEDIKSQALRDSHKETILMGVDKLEEIEVELRDFSSTTVAIDPSKLPEAKTIIREFRQKMAALLRDGEKMDVYQLAIQFYPLTKTNKEKN